MNDSFGKKYDAGKVRFDLLPPKTLRDVATVLTFGAEKYGAHNWTKDMPVSRYHSAAMRHILAFQAGEDLDPETGQPHLAHAMCCLIFMNETTGHQSLDDRFFASPTPLDFILHPPKKDDTNEL